MGKREDFAAHFREIHPKFSRFYATLLDSVNLTLPQYVLLNQLAVIGNISMTEASKRLGITKPAITNLVDKLEKKHLLKRLPHPNDRRIALLLLLPKGQKVVSDIQSRSIEIIMGAYDRFGNDEREIIKRFYIATSQILDDQNKRLDDEK